MWSFHHLRHKFSHTVCFLRFPKIWEQSCSKFFEQGFVFLESWSEVLVDSFTIWSVSSKVLAKDSPFWNHACGESDTGSFVDTESIHPDSHLRVKYNYISEQSSVPFGVVEMDEQTVGTYSKTWKTLWLPGFCCRVVGLLRQLCFNVYTQKSERISSLLA